MRIRKNVFEIGKKAASWLLISVMILGVLAACEPSVPLDDFMSGVPTDTEPAQSIAGNETTGNHGNIVNNGNNASSDNSDNNGDKPSAQPSEGLIYTLTNDETAYEVTGYEGFATDVIIASEYNGKPVVHISILAFHDRSDLTSISIPDSITGIDRYAFSGCTGLLHTQDGVSYVDNWLVQCDYYVTNVVVQDNTVGICDQAFMEHTDLTSVIIPDSVLYIGWGAFKECAKLSSVTIGDGVTSIGDNAFEDCGNLTDIVIPDRVTDIGQATFSDCNNLSRVIIGKSVTRIGDSAFNNCNRLTDITIPDRVTGIGKYAFAHCMDLTSISIPESVISIGQYAFSNCWSLDSITLPNHAISMHTSAFNWTSVYNNEANWVNGALYIGNHLIAANESLTNEYQIKSNTFSIADAAFATCTGLQSITIPDSITHIGDSAFYNCTDLINISFIGTTSEWSDIYLGEDWINDVPATEVVCSDGIVPLK